MLHIFSYTTALLEYIPDFLLEYIDLYNKFFQEGAHVTCASPFLCNKLFVTIFFATLNVVLAAVDSEASCHSFTSCFRHLTY